MKKREFEKGKSSLLFTISALISFIYSELFFYKLTNIVLIGTSYFCNAYDYELYTLLDYLCIVFIAMSYINNSIINAIILFCLILEYILSKKIKITLSISFTCVLFFMAYVTYHNKYEFFWISLILIFLSFITYILKYHFYLFERKILQDIPNAHIYTTNDLTYIWHIVIVCILSVTALTAK